MRILRGCALWFVSSSITLLLTATLSAQTCKLKDASSRSCILDDGTVNLVVNFRSPPLPAQVEHVKTVLIRSNEMLCDAADGQIRIGRVTLTHGEAAQKDADIWWYPQAGRGSSGYGLDKAHFNIFGYPVESAPCPRACNSMLPAGDPNGCDPDNNPATNDGCDRTLLPGTKFACVNCGSVWERTFQVDNAYTVAHELGHLLFEIGDQYDEQNTGSTGCGHGPGFDGPAGGLWSTRNGPVAMTTAQLMAAPIDGNVERNHTLMQQVGRYVCRDTTNSNFGFFDKFPDFADIGELPCNTDDDCSLPGNGGYNLGPNFKCTAPLVNSELSVDRNIEGQPGFGLVGTGISSPGSVASCAAAYGGTTFSTHEAAFGGRVWANTPARCGNRTLDSDEQCDASVPGTGPKPCVDLNMSLGSNFASGNAVCAANCTWDLSACVAPVPKDSCTGNTTPDPGEQCQPGQTSTCTAVKNDGGSGTGNTTCGANCAFDLSTCGSAGLLCGNNTIDGPFLGIGGEQCDGTALGGQTCVTQGFTAGTLSCGSNCYFDYSGCTRGPATPPLCGNGVLDPGEQCDSSSPAALPACPAGRTGTVACMPNCGLDLSGCSAIDFSLDTNTFQSAWDSSGFANQSTGTFDGVGQTYEPKSTHALWSFTAATSTPTTWNFVLATNRDDYTNRCGNGTVDAGEECDGGSKDCTTFPGGIWAAGMAACGANCKWNKATCTLPVPPAAPSTCGNSRVDGSEECDGATATSCKDLSLEGPKMPLMCRPNCSLDLTPCKAADFLELGRYSVVFDAASGDVKEINGLAYPANHPTIKLGGTTAPMPYGTLPTGAAGGQTAATGAFKTAGHPEVTIALAFDDLQRTAHVPTMDGSGEFFQRISLRSRFGTIAGVGDVPARGSCNDDFVCKFGWNTTTRRFESSGGTLEQLKAAADRGVDLSMDPEGQLRGEWALAAQNLMRWQLTSFVPYLGNQRPEEGVKPGTKPCGSPTFDDVDVSVPQQVVIVLDRSGSMAQEDAGGFGAHQRRLDFVKAAARNFVDLYSDATRPPAEFPEVGLVWFNHEQFTAFGAPGSLRKLIRGTCGSPTNPCANPNEIGNEYIKSEFLRDKDDPAGENPTPDGMTSIGGAIHAGGAMFGPAKGATQALLLLTDGEDNPPSGVTDDPKAEAQALINDTTKNVQFYTVPAIDGDVALSTELARMSNGEMLPVDAIDQTMPRFMDAFARQRGEELAVDRAPVAVQNSVCGPEDEFCEPPPAGVTPTADVTIPVEVDAERLNVLLSTRDGDPQVIGNPNFELRDPNGSVVATQTSSATRNDVFYRAISITAPMPGNWKLTVAGTSATRPQYSYVTAHVENPMPDCFVSVTPAIVLDTTTFEVQASALWGRELRDGVTLTGNIVQPDKTTIPLNFSWSDTRKKFIAPVEASSLTAGKGGYEVGVSCSVAEGASYLEGEDPTGLKPLAPQGTAHAFRRAASSWFQFDTTQSTVLKPGTDADGDGIPNASEPSGDFDNDGLDDAWDSDADNDDVPDGVDPAPHDPDVPRPNHGQCSVDSTAPVITAPDTAITQCNTGSVDRPIAVSATDASCFGNASIALTGQLVSVDGTALSPPIAISGADPHAILPLGSSVIQWTALDVNGNTSTATQTIAIAAAETSVACCSAGQTVINGTAFPDLLALPVGGPYCVFGNNGADTILTNFGSDSLFGGVSGDLLDCGPSSGDLLSGGTGDDWINLELGTQTTVYGGDGNDVIDQDNAGTAFGGAGDDYMTGATGTHVFYPGPGKDTVHAGAGDDTVVIRHVCEVVAGEVLDGGLGNDTLITPVPVTELIARGAILLGFQNVVIKTDEQYLSECF